MKLEALDRFVATVEKIAGLFLAAVAALTFVSVVLRGTFNIAIPDWYDLSRLLLGVTVLWGIATTSYRGEHIEVDILYTAVGTRLRRAIDIFASLVLFLFMAAFAWKLVEKVASGFASGEATFDLRLPIWPFHLLAALGIFATVILLGIRIFRLLAPVRTPEPR